MEDEHSAVSHSHQIVSCKQSVRVGNIAMLKVGNPSNNQLIVDSKISPNNDNNSTHNTVPVITSKTISPDSCEDNQNKSSDSCEDNQNKSPDSCEDNQNKSPDSCEDNQNKSPDSCEDNQNKSPDSCEDNQNKSPDSYEDNQNKSSNSCEDNQNKLPGSCEDNQNKSSDSCEDNQNKSPGSCEDNQNKSSDSCEDNQTKSPGSCEDNQNKSPGSCEDNQNKSPGSCEDNQNKSPGSCEDNQNKSLGSCEDNQNKSQGESDKSISSSARDEDMKILAATCYEYVMDMLENGNLPPIEEDNQPYEEDKVVYYLDLEPPAKKLPDPPASDAHKEDMQCLAMACYETVMEMIRNGDVTAEDHLHIVDNNPIYYLDVDGPSHRYELPLYNPPSPQQYPLSHLKKNSPPAEVHSHAGCKTASQQTHSQPLVAEEDTTSQCCMNVGSVDSLVVYSEQTQSDQVEEIIKDGKAASALKDDYSSKSKDISSNDLC